MIALILILEFIVLSLFSNLGSSIRNVIFYETFLVKHKYSIIEIARAKEHLLYFITVIFKKIPTISFRPNILKYNQLVEDKNNAVRITEKLIYLTLISLNNIRYFVGNVFIDLIIVLTYLIYSQIINLKTIFTWIEFCFDQLLLLDITSIINIVYLFIIKNGNSLLLLLIFILAIYIKFLKRQSKKYILEPIWTSEENKKIIELYRIQIELEKELLKLILPIQNNMKKCQNIIHLIDSYPEQPFDHTLSWKFEDYSNNLNRINNLLAEINTLEAIPIFYKHNKNAFLQLQIFGFFPQNYKSYFFNFENCNKHIIENIVFEPTYDNKKIRDELIASWIWGIAIENGINRYLKYNNLKKNKYLKTISIIDNIDFSEIVKKIV